MSLDQRLYNEFYSAFERDKNNGRFAKIYVNLGKYMRYVTAAGALYFGATLVSKLSGGDVSGRDVIINGGISAASTGLTMHFHDAKQIFEAMYKKNTGETLTEEETNKVKKLGKIGRYAHFGAATVMVGVLYTILPKESFFTLLPIMAAWYYLAINKGYGAIYNTAVDYTAGEKREFSK